MSFEIYDAINKMTYQINSADLFVPGTQFKDSSKTCYLAAFWNGHVDDTTWQLGNIMMKRYYIVFDATTVEKLNYLQVGIAVQASENLIGEQHYDPNSDIYYPERREEDQSVPINDGENPYDDPDYEDAAERREEEEENDIDELDIDKNGINDNMMLNWLKEHMIYVTIGGSSFLFLCISMIICCCCCKKKKRHDTYMFRTYSQMGGSIEELDVEDDSQRNNRIQ